MATDVKVPALGESITEGTLAQWLKKPGEAVAADEPIASLETDKVSVEVPSPVAGTFAEAVVAEGETVAVGAVIARIDEGGTAAASAPAGAAAAEAAEAAAELAHQVLGVDAVLLQHPGVLLGVDLVGQLRLGLRGLVVVPTGLQHLDDLRLVDLHRALLAVAGSADQVVAARRAQLLPVGLGRRLT